MQQRLIEGRVYRVVNVEAADTRAAARHTMAQRPTSQFDARALREFIDQARRDLAMQKLEGNLR